MKHKYFDVIVAWASGETIQLNLGNGWLDWTSTTTPGFCANEWRIKPRLMHATAMDGTVVEWPEPMRVAPEVGTEYWIPAPVIESKNRTERLQWDGYRIDLWLLENGWCHATEENAMNHAEAMIILTRGKP